MDLGCIREVDQDLTGDKNKIDSFRGVMMGLQYLTGEKIRFKMRLWCIWIRLQYLTGKKTIIDAFRMYNDAAS